jgi:hypothetical protein
MNFTNNQKKHNVLRVGFGLPELEPSAPKLGLKSPEKNPAKEKTPPTALEQQEPDKEHRVKAEKGQKVAPRRSPLGPKPA